MVTDTRVSPVRLVVLIVGSSDSFEHAQSVPVKYVPEKPALSRLLEGEVERRDVTKTPLGGYVLAGIILLFGMVCLPASALAWFGWDLNVDGGKIRIVRFGHTK